MSLHHLDPRHGELCLCQSKLDRELDRDPQPDCPTCHGTGRRGGDAEPVFSVDFYPHEPERGWYAYGGEDWEDVIAGPCDTEPDAVFAARCALAGVVVEYESGEDNHYHDGYPPLKGWYWLVKREGRHRAIGWDGRALTRDAALCAALDAKGGRS